MLAVTRVIRCQLPTAPPPTRITAASAETRAVRVRGSPNTPPQIKVGLHQDLYLLQRQELARPSSRRGRCRAACRTHARGIRVESKHKTSTERAVGSSVGSQNVNRTCSWKFQVRDNFIESARPHLKTQLYVASCNEGFHTQTYCPIFNRCLFMKTN